MRTRAILVVAALVLTASSSSAQIDPSKWFKSDTTSKLSTGDFVAGLKEALEIGTTDTVSLTSMVDGYFGNAAIKILLPQQLQSVDSQGKWRVPHGTRGRGRHARVICLAEDAPGSIQIPTDVAVSHAQAHQDPAAGRRRIVRDERKGLLGQGDHRWHVLATCGDHDPDREDLAQMVWLRLHERGQLTQKLLGTVELVVHEEAPGVGQPQLGPIEEDLGREGFQPPEGGGDSGAHRPLAGVLLEDVGGPRPVLNRKRWGKKVFLQT